MCLGSLLESSWKHLEGSWKPLGCFLEASWRHIAAIFILAASWRVLEGVLGGSGGVLKGSGREDVLGPGPRETITFATDSGPPELKPQD